MQYYELRFAILSSCDLAHLSSVCDLLLVYSISLPPFCMHVCVYSSIYMLSSLLYLILLISNFFSQKDEGIQVGFTWFVLDKERLEYSSAVLFLKEDQIPLHLLSADSLCKEAEHACEAGDPCCVAWARQHVHLRWHSQADGLHHCL